CSSGMPMAISSSFGGMNTGSTAKVKSCRRRMRNLRTGPQCGPYRQATGKRLIGTFIASLKPGADVAFYLHRVVVDILVGVRLLEFLREEIGQRIGAALGGVV